MKKLFFALSIFFLASCAAQKYTAADYPIPFQIEQIDTVAGTKDALFVKANEWVAKTFNSAKDVIQMHDKEAGKIIAKGIMETKGTIGLISGSYFIKYTISIDVKDGRCKVKFSDFVLNETRCYTTNGLHTKSYNSSFDNDKLPYNVSAKTWGNVKGDCWHQAKALLKDFKIHMNQKSENW